MHMKWVKRLVALTLIVVPALWLRSCAVGKIEVQDKGELERRIWPWTLPWVSPQADG